MTTQPSPSPASRAMQPLPHHQPAHSPARVLLFVIRRMGAHGLHDAMAAQNVAAGSAGPIAPFLAANASLRCAPFTVERFMLFESTLSTKGAHYDPVVAYPLC